MLEKNISQNSKREICSSSIHLVVRHNFSIQSVGSSRNFNKSLCSHWIHHGQHHRWSLFRRNFTIAKHWKYCLYFIDEQFEIDLENALTLQTFSHTSDRNGNTDRSLFDLFQTCQSTFHRRYWWIKIVFQKFTQFIDYNFNSQIVNNESSNWNNLPLKDNLKSKSSGTSRSKRFFRCGITDCLNLWKTSLQQHRLSKSIWRIW